jgi:membrane fusion protein (multidrug efflux system)
LVKAGQVLVKLDPIDAATNLARTGGALAQAVRQVRQQKSMADEYDEAITSRKLELARAEADLSRRKPLLAEQAIAAEELHHAQETVDLARAALAQSVRQASAAHALVDDTKVADNPAVLVAKAAYRDAWISAQRNAVLAPVSGFVAERSVQLGQHIGAGLPLMSVIPLNALWVDANFKEVQLRSLRIGQPAEVRSDLYGGTFLFHWHVKGMSAGTGAAFALLPAQNASGNWIKVVQRVPVRIQIDDQDLASHPLRIGLSTTVTVDTTTRTGAVLADDKQDQFSGDTQVYDQDIEKANAEADAIIRRHLGGAQ